MKRAKGKKNSSSPASAAEAAVLGNDDLLREILVRLDHPTCLVLAALVSKRWLRHASDPAFLRRFRGLHPPRILGLYVHGCGEPSRFVPLPHPRELDFVFRRARFKLDNENRVVVECRNGRVLVFRFEMDEEGVRVGFELCSPLHQTPNNIVNPSLNAWSYYLLPDDGGDGRSCIVVKLVRCLGNKIYAEHFAMQAGVKSEVRNSPIISLPSDWERQHSIESALLVNGKCYILGNVGVGYILGLDLESMCLRVINLPDGVQHHEKMKNIILTQADGSGFHLIHLKGFQIHVWHRGDSVDDGEWQLVDTICVRRVIAHHAKSDYWKFCLESGSSAVKLHRVGDNAEFLLNLEYAFFRMYIGSGKVEKVFEMPHDHDSIYRNSVVHPLMMVWPPRFPALTDEQVHRSPDD